MESKGAGDNQDLFDENEEINIEHSSESKEDSAFEEIVGALENIILAEEFQELQNSFCDRNCDIFEDNAENKLEYTSIFHEYTRCMEDHIQLKLRDVLPDMSMDRLEALILSKKDELSGDIFDIMASLTDFQEFKELMLGSKRAKTMITPSGKTGLDLSITGKHV